jgi:branched-chain amino acid transport system permease protein
VILQYVVAGLVVGGIYAITSVGLCLTYQSAGVLNFSFASMAYTVARCYYFLHAQHHWGIIPAAVLSILVLGPALGLLLYYMVFRFLALSSILIRTMATIGIAVALPPLVDVIFGTTEIISAPGLAPQPVKVFHVFGVGVSLDQVIVYAVVLVLLIVGFAVLRYTDVGLQIRAMVDSPAMTALAGTDPKRILILVWMFSSTLAGLVGVLVAPINGLDPGVMTLLMVSAFAAVIAARVSSLPVAVVVSFVMGIGSSVSQRYLPSASSLTADFLVAIPAVVIVISLIYFTVRKYSLDDLSAAGGALDRAIRPQGGESSQSIAQAVSTRMSWRPSAFGLLCLLALPLMLHGFWIGLLAEGMAYSVIFLSFSLLTGEGGMVWLCQATLAGVGGMAAALVTVDHGVPVLLSILIGGLFAIPFGLLVGALTVRMGNLYVALVTVTFGILVDNTIFQQTFGFNNGYGVTVNPPTFATGHRALAYTIIGVFILISALLVNLRRSTSGLVLAAVRASPTGARTLGINVVQMKVLLGGVAAFVAGIGGGLLAITLGTALPSNYGTLMGEVWLTVLVTQGIRSNAAAAAAGVGQTLLAGLILIYLPRTFGNFLPILFGLGATAMVKFPEGVLTMQARQLRSVLAKVAASRPKLYTHLKIVGVIYLVVFVALLKTVGSLWWLWLAATAVVAHFVAGYLVVSNQRQDHSRDEPNVHKRRAVSERTGVS